MRRCVCAVWRRRYGWGVVVATDGPANPTFQLRSVIQRLWSLRDSFRIQLERCEPHIPKLKNKNEQGGLGRLARRRNDSKTIEHSHATSRWSESDAVARSFSWLNRRRAAVAAPAATIPLFRNDRRFLEPLKTLPFSFIAISFLAIEFRSGRSRLAKRKE